MVKSKTWLRLASLGFIMLIPLMALFLLVGLVLYWGFDVRILGKNFIILADQGPVPERKVYGALASLPATLLWVYALWRLFLLFFNFQIGKLVNEKTISHLRCFSLFSLLSVTSGFLLSGVVRWAMGVFDNEPLWTHLGFSDTHGAVLFSAAIIYVVTHIIEEGFAYKKETKEYV
ncbi:MAG: hypothetical protein JKX72_10110 [Robiginitomaculum sp.]|nr:hypothetical protein [Robiginitomaculum sp.]